MIKKRLFLLLALLLIFGTIALAGCGAPPEEEFHIEEDPLTDPQAEEEEEHYLDPETEDDPYERDL